MTTPPLTDEDLSAVIDGEADAPLVARVDADPAAQQRLQAMRAAAEALRATPVPGLDPSTIDSLIGRAISEGAQPEPTASNDAGSATVTPLAPPRSASGTGPRWLAAAAIVVLVAVGLALVWTGTRGSEEDTAAVTSTEASADQGAGRAGEGSGPADPDDGVATEDSASEDSAGEAPQPGDTPEAVPPGPVGSDPFTPGDPGGVPSLGSFDTITDLREALRDDFPSGAPSSTDIAQDQALVDRCDLLMQEVFSLPADARAVGVAEVDGEDLLVYEYDAPSQRDGSPTTFVTANEPDSCDALLSFERSTG